MRVEVANALHAAAEELGIDARLDENYSGRGMCGRSTAAVSFDSPGQLAASAVLAANSPEKSWGIDLVEELLGLRQDSLGRQTIFY
jgi:hypothetical protein